MEDEVAFEDEDRLSFQDLENDEPPFWERPNEFVKFGLKLKVKTGPIRNMREGLKLWVQVNGSLSNSQEELFDNLVAPASEIEHTVFSDDHVGDVQSLMIGHNSLTGAGVWIEGVTLEDLSNQTLYTFDAKVWLHRDVEDETPVAILSNPLTEKIPLSVPKEKLVVIKLRCGSEAELMQGLTKFSQWCAAKGTRCLHISVNRSKTKADLHVAVPKLQVDYRRLCSILARNIQKLLWRHTARNRWFDVRDAALTLSLAAATSLSVSNLRTLKSSSQFLVVFSRQLLARKQFVAEKNAASMFSALVRRHVQHEWMVKWLIAKYVIESAVTRRLRRFKLWRQRGALVWIEATCRRVLGQRLYHSWLKITQMEAVLARRDSESDAHDPLSRRMSSLSDDIKSAGLSSMRSKIGKLGIGRGFMQFLTNRIHQSSPNNPNIIEEEDLLNVAPNVPLPEKKLDISVRERFKDCKGAWRAVGEVPKMPPVVLPLTSEERHKLVRKSDEKTANIYSAVPPEIHKFQSPLPPVSARGPRNSPRVSSYKMVQQPDSKQPIDDMIFWLQNSPVDSEIGQRYARRLTHLKNSAKLGQIATHKPFRDQRFRAFLPYAAPEYIGDSAGGQRREKNPYVSELLQNILSEEVTNSRFLSDLPCETLLLPAIHK